MKKHLVKLSLALLSAVFILGCQDLGTGVVASDGPGPQFDKKGSGTCDAAASGGHCHGDEDPDPLPEPFDTFNVTFEQDCGGTACDITGGGLFFDRPDDNNTSLAAPGFSPASLNLLSSFQGEIAGGGTCFATGSPFDINGSIDPLGPNSEIQFHFTADDKRNDGVVTETFYTLLLVDLVFDPLTWPPDGSATLTITGGTFGLVGGGGGGGRRKDACKGNGDLLFSITVTKK